MNAPAETTDPTPTPEPLPVREPGATLRDNPIPDWHQHHAHKAFGDD